MSVESLFRMHLVLGYVAWSLCFAAYIWPWLKSMKLVEAQRAIATLHSFRFIGLVFLLPGVVSPDMPSRFATFAAYGDFATAVLAILALLAIRVRWLFFLFVISFNTVGVIDLVVNYYHAIRISLPAHAGLFSSAYWIPVIYVPLLMITHISAFYLLIRRQVRIAIGQSVVAAE